MDKAIRVELEGAGEGESPLVKNGALNAEVDLGRREIAERGMVMLVVVPRKESAAMRERVIGPVEFVRERECAGGSADRWK